MTYQIVKSSRLPRLKSAADTSHFRYSLLILLLLLTGKVTSQTFDAGLTGGIVGSQISGDNLGGFNKAGFQAGAFSGFKLSEKIGVRFEMYYIQKGSRKNYNPEEPQFPFYLLRLHYVEVPILLRYHHKRFVFEGGLSYGTLFKSLEEDVSGVLPSTIPFKRSEIAGQVGIGTNITDNLAMVWRYSNSLLPVRGHSGGASYYFNMGQYNSVIEFLLQYTLKNRD